jgi:hypothetical protein
VKGNYRRPQCNSRTRTAMAKTRLESHEVASTLRRVEALGMIDIARGRNTHQSTFIWPLIKAGVPLERPTLLPGLFLALRRARLPSPKRRGVG